MRKEIVIKSVEVLPTQNAIQVAWDNNIIDDDDVTVLASTIHRKAYISGERAQFMEEVSDAAKYVDLIAWDA